MPTCGREAIPNIRPFAHAANAIEQPGGNIFVTWYCGSYEGSEDQRIAGTVRTPNGEWLPTHIVVDRFDHDGDTWVPETAVPLPHPGGGLRLFFFASPLSGFRLTTNRGVVHIAGGSGGGSFSPLPSVPYEASVWTRDLSRTRLFFAALGPAYTTRHPQSFTEERGLILLGAAHRLQSGRWLLPYHTERKDCWFRSRFFLFDERQEGYEIRGDIFAEPGCLEPVVVQLESGRILCYMRRGSFDGHVWCAVSDDECQTFTPPTQTNLRNPHSSVDIAVSRSSGCLLLVYNDSYRQRTPLSVGISYDGGKTFRMKDIESRPGAFAYPKLLQDSGGLWHLFYTYEYRHIQHVWFDEAWLEEGRQVLG